MLIEFKRSIANGKITAPPSKSYAHRALICAAFSDNSKIYNLELSDDIKATIACLKKLGSKIDFINDGVSVKGIDINKTEDMTEIDCNESGSTLRFLIPICLTFGKKIIIKCSKRLAERPLDEYENLCKDNGFLFSKNGSNITVCGNLSAGNYKICGSVSSQFISGMLLALSVIDGKSVLEVIGKSESKPYIDITLDVLKNFGVFVDKEHKKFTVNGNNKLKNSEFTVEGDCSNSAYIEAFSFLGGNVYVNGINNSTVQGDIIYKRYFKQLLSGTKVFELEDFPDLAPIMFSLSCFCNGAIFNGIKRLKFKESDRANTMKTELEKFGVKIEISDNSLSVDASKIHSPNSILQSHNDHRIVMALSLLCAKFGGKIEGAEAVNKSYPSFFEQLGKLGVKFTEYGIE
ncbi:MAG: 3-phosphoshikimate 1-carboxyvinyltransferase [Clostridia bacterium]|nr:3-phosphoshikimate 1-carboxyvinyltransferase [Clostridia bacterium]